MSKDVNAPPALIAQETAAWCFAAAEQMVRAYYGLAARSQYDIAYDSVQREVGTGILPLTNQWWLAQALDASLGINTDITPAQLAVSGNPPNVNSQQVGLVRNTYGSMDHLACNGTLGNVCTMGNFRADIESNKIVVIGNAIHYYVVYGYNDVGGFSLNVRDPWPAGVGGALTSIPYNTFNGWGGKTVIRF